jgi:membrane fusion protein (multidrug efflux system)
MKMKSWVWAASLVALLALAGAGCSKGSSGPPPPPPMEVEGHTVGTAPVEDVLGAVGTVEANEIVEVKPEVAGTIRAIHFVEGQQVARGAKLFELDPAKQDAVLAQVRADLDLARANVERARSLAGTKAISQQEIDRLESELAVRAANLKLEEERSRDLALTAPFDGVLGPRTVSLGQYVNAGATLATLVDQSRVKVTYRVPERELGRLAVGQKVKLTVAAYAGRVFDGEIDLINPVLDEASRTVQVRALAANPDGLLRSGMFARVETVTGRREAALVIPERSLVPSLAGFAVYLVSNDVARLTPVALGARLPGHVEVREGLALGQTVVVGGTQKLVDGTPVAVVANASTNAAAATPKG